MKHLLLALLRPGPRYGLELKQHHDRLVGVVSGPVNVGQIYTTLGRLERDGLVAHRVEPSDVGPNRKVYELTEVGAKEVERWLQTPPAGPELKSEALTKIVAAIELDRPELPDLVRDHRQSCLEALRALDMAMAESDGSPAADALTQAAALHIQADLRWLDHIESTATGRRAKQLSTKHRTKQQAKQRGRSGSRKER